LLYAVIDSGGARVSGARGHRSFWRPLLPSLLLPLEVAALEVGPLNPVRGSGKRRKLPSGVWGETSAANDFGAF